MAKKTEEAPKKEKKRKELRIESLALTYRPKTIEDLVGQDHIAAELKGMLKRGRFPNTILLNGESGCGKTTTGRMIARYLMCKKPDKETYAPCGECQSCLYEDSHPDVHELNMAESRGIDDVRSLIQSSKSMPTVAENRIFLIDEIHAMTPAAAQCLTPDAEVLLTSGDYMRIGDLASAQHGLVLGFDLASHTTKPAEVLAGLTQVSDDKILLEIETEAGTFRVTSDHKVWSVTRNTYVKAADLQSGEELLLT